jgi:hypothetical protein
MGTFFLLFQKAEWGEWIDGRHKVASRRPNGGRINYVRPTSTALRIVAPGPAADTYRSTTSAGISWNALKPHSVAQIGGSVRGYQGLPAQMAISATATQTAARPYFYASPALA